MTPSQRAIAVCAQEHTRACPATRPHCLMSSGARCLPPREEMTDQKIVILVPIRLLSIDDTSERTGCVKMVHQDGLHSHYLKPVTQ